jgi:rhodanese-related sulfurtransferase
MKKRFLMVLIVAIAILAVSIFSIISCKTPLTDEEEMTIEETASEESVEEDMTEEEMQTEELVDDNEMMDEEMMSEYMDVTPEEAKKLIDETPDLLIIDVSPKYDAGHLPGAVNYYIGDGSLDDAIPTLDPEGKYLVYCHVDSASIPGAQALIDAGFKNVYRLEGNYAAWVDAGYDIEM